MSITAKAIVAGFGAIAHAAPIVSDDCKQAFKEFMVDYKKSYNSAEEERQRLLIFASNYEIIEAHKLLKDSSYTLAVNEFADQTLEEVRSTRLGLSLPANGTRWKGLAYLGRDSYTGAALADAVDWVSKGAVTPVKNQQRCGSCWAFSTTGAIEGAWQIASGNLVTVSEQQLVDCSKRNNGCSGGSMDAGFEFEEGQALCSEDEYPYKAVAGTCDEDKCSAIPKGAVTGFKDVDADSDEALMEALAKGPVSVAIEADKTAFQLYHSGILSSPECGTKLDHGVLAVGYGTDNGVDYWKVKNSWGPSWGDEGYVRLARGGSTSRLGECGILQMASYPVVSKASNIIV